METSIKPIIFILQFWVNNLSYTWLNYSCTSGIDFEVELNLPEKYTRVGGIIRFVFRNGKLFPAEGKGARIYDQIKGDFVGLNQADGKS